MKSIDTLNGIYRGRTAFVAGSGTSLREVDPDLLTNGVVIAVNSSVAKLCNCDYWFGCDARITLRQSWQILKRINCRLVVRHSAGSSFRCYDHSTGRNSFEGISPERMYTFETDRDNKYKMTDIGKTLTGTSSAHPAAHFAFRLGCDPIVLLGMDCRLVDGEQYYQPDPLENPDWASLINEESQSILGSFHNTWVEMTRSNPNVHFVNCGKANIDGMEPMSFEKAIELYA